MAATIESFAGDRGVVRGVLPIREHTDALRRRDGTRREGLDRTIGRYFNNRLKSIFAAVADEPKVLRNSANSPLYLLCFAVGNPRGAPIALRIANHLLKKGTE
jgi:hypothetical protein